MSVNSSQKKVRKALNEFYERPSTVLFPVQVSRSSLSEVPSESLRGMVSVDIINKYVRMQDIPTSDPTVEDVVWSDSGVLTLSSG